MRYVSWASMIMCLLWSLFYQGFLFAEELIPWDRSITPPGWILYCGFFSLPSAIILLLLSSVILTSEAETDLHQRGRNRARGWTGLFSLVLPLMAMVSTTLGSRASLLATIGILVLLDLGLIPLHRQILRRLTQSAAADET